MAVHPELEVLFTANRIHQDRAAIPAHLDDPVPQCIPDASRNVTDENFWADLEQPSGEMSA